MFFNLDPDVKNIMDSGGSKEIASITTRVTFDTKSWYRSELVNKKIREFHDKHAEVPTDNCAKVICDKYVESLENYLKSKTLCNRVEFTGNIHFSWHINELFLHEGLEPLILKLVIWFCIPV